MATKFSTVRTTAPSQVARYLYSGTIIVAQTGPDFRGTTTFLLRTDATTDELAESMAEHQVGRLNSGMHWSQVATDQARALEIFTTAINEIIE